MLGGSQPAPAQVKGLPLVRDAEIENLMRIYSRPIFKVAGINETAVNVYLVRQPSINAFVAGGQRIFINTGLLTQAKNPNEVIGVLAHETGHIAGGHLARMGQQLDKASTQAIIGMLLGAAAMVGGAASGSGEAAQAGQGIMLGSQGLAQRNLLAYVRAQESAADQAAIGFLDATGQSGSGMIYAVPEARQPVPGVADQCQSLCAVSSDAARAHSQPRGRSEEKPVLRSAGLGEPGAAASADAGEASGFSEWSASGVPEVSYPRQEPAGPLRAGDRLVSDR